MTLRSDDFPIDRPPGARDFDFLFGRWRVHNRRLWRRLVGSDDWEEFSASLEVRPILGGLGNVDQYRTLLDECYFEGVSIRLFNLETGLWRIYWADTDRGELLPPVVGGFEDGVGTFFGEDRHGEVPVRVRFTWQSLGPGSARWEQAFSADGGESWETNWIMDFKRE